MKIVVLGGGFAGLAAATRLVDEGHSVTLIERRPILGGRAYSLTDETTGDSIDNGQHLFMGCYSATRNFLSRIGSKLAFDHDLDLQMADGDERIRLRASPLPPPLHMISLPLGLRDRLSMLKVAASLKFPSARIPEPSDWETVDAWLDRMGQSAAARRLLWHPLAIATLNDDPPRASAKMLGAVVREALLGSREASRLGVPAVGLSKLYCEGAAQYLSERNATVKLASPVEKLIVDGVGGEAVVRGVRLKSEELLADAVVAAVPPSALHALIPDEVRAGDPYFENLLRLQSSPIVSVHLWLDRPVLDVPMLGLVDSPIHWIFDRKSHLSMVTSSAVSLIDRDAAEIVSIARRELERVVSSARGVRLRHCRVLKERDATIAHTAGSEGFRPRARSPVGGLFVAGDYVRTGLPATIESAVRAADECSTLVAGWQPPPRAPSPPGLVPIGRLVRVTTP